jgi:hypothetical protein
MLRWSTQLQDRVLWPKDGRCPQMRSDNRAFAIFLDSLSADVEVVMIVWFKHMSICYNGRSDHPLSVIFDLSPEFRPSLTNHLSDHVSGT